MEGVCTHETHSLRIRIVTGSTSNRDANMKANNDDDNDEDDDNNDNDKI